MIVTQEEVVDRQTVIHIELEDDDLDPYVERGYRRFVQRTRVPGFRKGKAPRRIIEQYFGRESLLNEVLETMLPEVTNKAITEQELDSAGLPRIELLDIEPFKLKATVPLLPQVTLGPYQDLHIPEHPIEVTKKDVQEQIERLQYTMASWEPVERPTEMGDLVTVDAVGTVDSQTVLDEKDAVFLLDEDAARPFPGFSQHMIGLVSNSTKKFTIAIPGDYSDSSLAGKEACFSVTLSEHKQRILPDLDDEFAKSVGKGYDSLEAFRQEVEQDLEAKTRSKGDQQYKESVIVALLESTTVELPPIMVEHEVEHMENDRARTLARVNVRMDDYLQSVGKTEEQMRSDIQVEAVERLKRTFALSRVTELEGLETSSEEVDERVQSILASSGELSENRPVSDELRESIRQMLLAEKTLGRLVAIAKGESQVANDQKPVGGKPDTKGKTN